MSSPVPQRPLEGAESETPNEMVVERYKYILQQIHTLNENAYRFLAIYQALSTAIVGAGLALFVGYKKWAIPPPTARSGLVALMWLETLVAAFTGLLILIGIVSWIDYRKEECELTDEFIRPGFRKAPRVKSIIRWYETYIVIFILGSTAVMWVYIMQLLLPGIK